MTYAKRNSLIMLGVMVLMVGAGWLRFYMVEDAEINRLNEEILQKHEQLQKYKETANTYDNLVAQYQTLQDNVNESAKLLVKAKNADQVYSSLISLGRDSAFTYMNFVSVDSTHYDQFGLLNFDIRGEGHYKNFNQFINRLEYGRPLFRIRSMSIEPRTELDNLGRVNYSFKLESLYDRDSIFDDYSEQPKKELPAYTYNSFYPLVHEVVENDANLVNVEQSKLVSVGENFISLRDQNGTLQHLYVGDRVYLGKLITVNTAQNSAVFELNKGGIIKYITRELR